MATAGGKKKLPAKVSVPFGNYVPPPLPVDAVVHNKADGREIMGWIAACALIVFLLPLLGMLYVDILIAKNDAKDQIEKVEKLRREVEKLKRDKE
jgi:hypothetical protein